VLPEEVDRVLWLDCDIVVEGNVLDLWRQDTAGQIIGAVIDYGSPTVGFSYGTARTYEECQISAETPHFNSGVMIIDLLRWRQADVSQRVLDYSFRFEDKLAYMDQDGLNIVIAGAWQQLPLEWNVQVAALCSLERLKPATAADSIEARHFDHMLEARSGLLANARLIHYISGKPWNSGLRMPLYSRWFWWLQRSKLLGGWEFQLFRLKCWQQAWSRAIKQRVGK
jgi:lipopolysaccharide biosynthesis glycosyltransferase